MKYTHSLNRLLTSDKSAEYNNYSIVNLPLKLSFHPN